MPASTQGLDGAPSCARVRTPPREVAASEDVGAPTPRVLLRVEQVTVDRSVGLGALLETVSTPVLALSFVPLRQLVAVAFAFWAASLAKRTRDEG